VDKKQAVLNKINFRAYYTSIIGELGSAGPDGWTKNSKCIFHNESNGSFGVNMFNGQYKCFGCDAHGSIFDFHINAHGVDFKTALHQLADFAGVDLNSDIRHYELGKPIKIYSYDNATGDTLFYVCRFEPKKFRPCDPNGRWKVKDIVEPVPYNLPQVLKADTVFLTEGEKDADTINRLGLVGTCKANWTGHWTQEYATKYFNGKAVNILQDNDEAGKTKAIDAAESLSRANDTIVKILPPFSPGGL
jgi:DNA primase